MAKQSPFNKDGESIPIFIPKEYVDEMEKIIWAGLRYARISPETRAILKTWWEVEENFVNEEVDKIKAA